MKKTNKKSKTTKDFTEILDSFLAINLEEGPVIVSLISESPEDRTFDVHNLQLTDGLAATFREVVINRFKKLKKEHAAGNLNVRPYSPGSKPDHHELEYMRIADHPNIRKQLTPLSSLLDLKPFDGSNDFISGLRSYVITMQLNDGRPLYCFRSYSPKKEISRSKIFAAVFAKGYFDHVRDPMFLFDEHLDVLVYGNTVLIISQDKFHKIFHYFQLVVETAEETLKVIKKAIPISNFSEFEAACLGHFQKLAKLRNISQKAYMQRITIEDLKKAITKFELNVKVIEEAGKEKLVFDPTDKWSILRLLDDDYLESTLTEEKYEVTGKRPYA